jgi:Protein of unknown function (DUF3307)
MPSVPLLLKLVLAHLAGDYLVQSRDVALGKHRASLLGMHLALHGALLLMVAWTEPQTLRLWIALAVLLAAHGAIDAWTSRRTPRDLRLLTLDQGLHAVTLFAAVWIARPEQGAAISGTLAAAVRDPRAWTIGAGALGAVWAGAVLVGRIVAPFAAALGKAGEAGRPGLERAGWTIGVLERALVFLAMLLRAEALVGFVIAAKAILRLPEARDPAHRALAEYYLVGSLASVFWAVLLGVLVRWSVSGKF